MVLTADVHRHSDAVTGRWNAVEDPENSPRIARHCSVAVGTKIFIFGGSDGTGTKKTFSFSLTFEHQPFVVGFYRRVKTFDTGTVEPDSWF